MAAPPAAAVQFPLRWESTGDQWWYASPIDWAAANGLYDLVAELLHLDTNLLIKLTSLRRIRRLETVWDDDDSSDFRGVATCRSTVARRLLRECESPATGYNSLLRAGYGGWLLYTAASAADVDFIEELLRRDPLLVFGEGEYGVTDMLYAAARSKDCQVFRLLLDSALLSRKLGCLAGEGEDEFKREMINRSVHASARGGNWEMLKELLTEDAVSEITCYRDSQGATVLHSASGRGQLQVVRNLIESFDIIDSIDAEGNTALHVASYRGYSAVVEVLIQASPALASVTNHYGDTFLHMAVSGFRSPGFRRLDKHTELINQLVSGKFVKNMQDIVNVRNNDGRTALHVAVIHNIQCDIVELLMSVPSIDLNIRDTDGMTPLDHLRQRPKSASSEILIKHLISAGGIANCQDYVARNALVTHLKTHGIGTSPGTSFRIPDAEIFLHTGIENSCDASYDQASVESNSWSGELSNCDSASSQRSTKSNSINSAARRLKSFFEWQRRRKKKTATSETGDNDSVASFASSKKSEDFPVPLRQRYTNACSLPNNKRTLAIRPFLPSPSSKKYFAAGLMQGVIQVKPHMPFQEQKGVVDMMEASCSNRPKETDGTLQQVNFKQGSFNKKLMNRYLSFGAHGQAFEGANRKNLSSLVA